ncbi:GNAT family N-acetyltransferase [Aneurinibacillus aneurinilyticus]|uniref:Acetyltransferase, GNAT family n=1 Tax=Aneurinibacillus aneurinilyticus ATCC 12856 TaxID=649747 RepID=U1XYX1_ANEAE|nr:GNAT family N-acetyltransferase [Aneurinibacillus aneurinilyticus]ERI03951.1 acetyltransferase, GNAT family [Aneurinibacillus aneurinilyticus ATCC 12856]MED0705471.1 GNAT family N-acetyltransferase [Aneurinibacillus aneurinilyticus]MED0721897.1 GNAT family N-acetyltransferase [Aneurinibacillus aneurinilyticus]MED0731513.1 GNAT family N-acetyltransferase [Aneurinibacillus aneurinilyticus]MED0743045.1 GNAT family N-acetyltransferase [Aneurinibacillus aneurinilyticus]
MLELKLLTPESAKPYKTFTYQSFREKIIDFAVSPEVRPIVVGASFMGNPVGLIVAGCDRKGATANVVSIFVQQSFRNIGIGTALMNYLLDYLQSEKFLKVIIQYYGLTNIHILEKILEKSGWEPPQLYSRYYRLELKNLVGFRWMDRMKLPPPYRLVSWGDVSREEREQVKNLDEAGYRSYYDPSENEKAVVDTCSYFLKEKDTIIGWSIVERHLEDTLLYRVLYVREAYRDKGLGLVLAAKTAHGALASRIPYGVIQIVATNERMQKIYKRIIEPLSPVITPYWNCEKDLSS